MPYTKIWIHLIWSTKCRYPYLTKPARYLIFKHMQRIGREKGIEINFINGYEDHVHLLIFLKPTQNISHIVRQIKGESSNWINKNCILNSEFNWQREYMALSVGRNEVKRIRNYIRNQEEHHSKRNYTEEFKDLSGENYHILDD